ncbi:alpha/beta fold hydrolase [Verrucosispora sp. WMMA2121]|uniref:alpha/beta hydrolase family protein n=1 Tax=Verrucosispora sp. WMMA2121 TaxID=3015164 RepID=UPI0022B73A8C|nr:alpha/beta fold hydrolase [Verrucosispora sp. WMMA2121]MCZ7418547.1 alpha/beta fold hydrolase [Verrucosispora sp. WMMA2121]
MLFEPVSTELSFRHDGDELVGDLVRPPAPGPYPAVVFVEGSGPGGRDLGEWPTRLAAAGFASLAYDKPGSGASTGDWTRQRLTDRAEETLAAVRALRQQPDVRADAVALIGHSQGGWVAPLAAARSDTVAAVVCVSGPGVGVLAQEEHRLRHQLPAEGFTGADVEQALRLLHEQVHRVRSGDDPVRVHAAQARWHTAPWSALLAGTTPRSIAFLAGIADHDPAVALRSLTCPMLAVYGAEDLLVPVWESARTVATVLREAGHQDHEIVVFPGADHNIRVRAARAPGFDELIVTWLQRRLCSR